MVQLASSSGSSKTSTIFGDSEYLGQRTKSSNKRSVIFSDRLLAGLDKSKISDRTAMHLITAVIVSLGENVDHFVLRTARENYRASTAEAIQNYFHVILNNQLID